MHETQTAEIENEEGQNGTGRIEFQPEPNVLLLSGGEKVTTPTRDLRLDMNATLRKTNTGDATNRENGWQRPMPKAPGHQPLITERVVPDDDSPTKETHDTGPIFNESHVKHTDRKPAHRIGSIGSMMNRARRFLNPWRRTKPYRGAKGDFRKLGTW